MPYSIIPNKLTVDEGDLVTFTITFDPAFFGQRAYFEHIGTSKKSDWLQNLDERSSFIVSTSPVNLSVLTRVDTQDEVETIQWKMSQQNGTILAISPIVYIRDKSFIKIFDPRWEKTGFLGTLTTGETSELYVKAYPNTSTFQFNYLLNSGSLPDGLVLQKDGNITGKPKIFLTSSTFSSNFTFNISAVDRYNNVFLTSNFSIDVKQTDSVEYTKLYSTPLWPVTKRLEYKNFVLNKKIFPPNFIYRESDPNFGLSYVPKLVISYGIKRLLLREYGEIINKNFSRRKYQLLDFKIGYTKNSTGDILHELIYIEVFDKLNPNLNQNVDFEFTFNGIKYYGPSIKNQRSLLSLKTKITDKFNPAFIKNISKDDLEILNFKSFIPVCFANPGKSQTILRNIKESGFKLNMIDFEIERVYIENPIINDFESQNTVQFDIDSFVKEKRGIYRTTIYKSQTEKILPLYMSNNEFILSTGEKRWGLYRYPDSVGLSYWVNQTLEQVINPQSVQFYDMFFGAVDYYYQSRHLTPYKGFDFSLSNVFTDSSQGPFLVKVNPSIVSEGTQVTFSILTHGIEEGTTATYQISGITTTDLSGSPALEGIIEIGLPPIPRFTNFGQSGHWHMEREFSLSNSIKNDFYKKGKEIIVSREMFWNQEHGIYGSNLVDHITEAHNLGLRAGISVSPYAVSGDGVLPPIVDQTTLKGEISSSGCDFVSINAHYIKTNGSNIWTTSSLYSWAVDIITHSQNLGKYTKIILQGYADPGTESTALYYNTLLMNIPNIEEFIVSDLSNLSRHVILNNKFKPQVSTTSLTYTLISDNAIESEYITFSCRGSSASAQIVDIPYTDKYILMDRKPPLK